MITAAASTVKVYGGFTSYTHNSTKSTAKVVMAFNWNGRTSRYGQDIFAVTWTGFKVKSSTGTLGYVSDHVKAPTKYQSKSGTVTPDGTYADYMRFAKWYEYGTLTGINYFCYSGSITYEFEASYNVVDPVVYAEYGYNTVTLTPSVDFTGGLGMEFSTGVKSIGQARVYAD